MRIDTRLGWRSLTLVAAALLLVAACSPRPALPNQNQVTPTAVAPAATEQEAAYRREVVAILAPYFAGQATTGITQRLLALTVPGRFQDLHLQLVLAFSRFDTARANGDADAAETAAAQLDAVVVKYPWVKGTPPGANATP